MLNNYECVFIEREHINNVKEGSENILKYIKENAEIRVFEDAGLRNFAYSIQGNDSGYFYYIRFISESSFISKLERKLRLSKNVLKFIVMRTDD